MRGGGRLLLVVGLTLAGLCAAWPFRGRSAGDETAPAVADVSRWSGPAVPLEISGRPTPLADPQADAPQPAPPTPSDSTPAVGRPPVLRRAREPDHPGPPPTARDAHTRDAAAAAPPEPARRFPSLERTWDQPPGRPPSASADPPSSAAGANDLEAGELPAARVVQRAAPGGRPARELPTRRHRILDGDSLPELAARYLGSRERYLEIFQANRDVLAAPDVLPLGRTLVIPEP